MEEIDIVELFKRVKEGKAPKEIEIGNFTFNLNKNNTKGIRFLYELIEGQCIYYWIDLATIDANTKITILDKYKTEEIDEAIGKFINDFEYIDDCIWESNLYDRKKKEYSECLVKLKTKLEEEYYKE